jgi:predicted Zn-dependent protease with MMP-like domain
MDDATANRPATGRGPDPGPHAASSGGPGHVPDLFEAALAAAIDRLPDPYRAQLATVAIVVADEPSAEELAATGARGLLGLYRGVPRTVQGASHAAVPSVITLYRGPLQRTYRSPAALAAGVEETLRHELAHHLGISDARLVELKRGAPGGSR